MQTFHAPCRPCMSDGAASGKVVGAPKTCACKPDSLSQPACGENDLSCCGLDLAPFPSAAPIFLHGSKGYVGRVLSNTLMGDKGLED